MRKLGLIVSLVAAVASAAPIQVKVVADHADLVYRCGEKVKFSVELTDKTTGNLLTNGQANVIVDNYGTNVYLRERRDFSKQSARFEVEATRTDAGCLRIFVDAFSGYFAYCNVLFEPENIQPAVPRPADFDAYWEGELERVSREIPLELKMEKRDDLSNAACDVYGISYAVDNRGRRLYAWLSIPKAAAAAPEKKWPVRVQAAAAGYGGWTVDAQRFSDEISLFFTVYDFLPAAFNSSAGVKDYQAFNKAWCEKYGVATYARGGFAASREEVFFHDIWLGMTRVVDWLAARPDVDLTHFTYVGESQGGATGFFLLAMNTHFTKGVLQVPACTGIVDREAAGRQCGWPNPLADAKTPEAVAAVLKNAPYFDGVNFASRIKIPVRVCLGTLDPTCPPHAVRAAFNQISSKDKEIIHGLGDNHNSDSQGQRRKFNAWRRAK